MSSTQLVVTGSMNLLGGNSCVYTYAYYLVAFPEHVDRERESDNKAKHLGSGIPVVVTE